MHYGAVRDLCRLGVHLRAAWTQGLADNLLSAAQSVRRSSYFLLESRQLQSVDSDLGQAECAHRVLERSHRVGNGDSRGAPHQSTDEANERSIAGGIRERDAVLYLPPRVRTKRSKVAEGL